MLKRAEVAGDDLAFFYACAAVLGWAQRKLAFGACRVEIALKALDPLQVKPVQLCHLDLSELAIKIIIQTHVFEDEQGI